MLPPGGEANLRRREFVGLLGGASACASVPRGRHPGSGHETRNYSSMPTEAATRSDRGGQYHELTLITLPYAAFNIQGGESSSQGWVAPRQLPNDRLRTKCAPLQPGHSVVCLLSDNKRKCRSVANRLSVCQQHLML
jgi:hypothetical protein